MSVIFMEDNDFVLEFILLVILPNSACSCPLSQASCEDLYQHHWQTHSPKTGFEDTLLLSGEA